MKIPVYIQATVSKYIGDVEVEHKDAYESEAYDLWESQQFDYPTICHQCAGEMDLGDWDIDLTDI